MAKSLLLTPLYIQNIFFYARSANFATAQSTPVGPVSPGLDTVLTNKPAGPPGRHFTRQQKFGLLSDIYQEGLLAKEALRRFDGMSELEMAEAELSEAQAAHDEATERQKTSYSRRDYEDAEEAAAKVSAARERVSDLRAKDAKRRALDEARAKIKKQVSDAIAKRRGH